MYMRCRINQNYWCCHFSVLRLLLCRYAWSDAGPISFINCHATSFKNDFQANSRDRLHTLFARPWQAWL